MDGFTELALKLINHEGSGTLFPPLMRESIEQRYLKTSLFSAFRSSNLEITKTTHQFDVSDYGFLLPAATRQPVAPFPGFNYNIDDEMSESQKLLLLQSSEDNYGDYQRLMIGSGNDHLGSVLDQRPSPNKRVRLSDETLEGILRNYQFLSNPGSSSPPISLKSPPSPARKLRSPTQSAQAARDRRQLVSNKTRILQKLMPWDKKMDIATMLEEAYKYIKFLQAQVMALQSMPCQSSFITPLQMMTVDGGVSGGSGSGGGAANDNELFGGLEKLNRQQLLQVLVNSPVVQTALYSQECCIYSTEQLILLNNKFVLQEMMSSSSSSSSSLIDRS